MTRGLNILAFLLWLGSAESASARDFRDPVQRTTQATAYGLAPKQWSVDAALLGVEDGDALGRIGLGYGFGRGLTLDTNLAHSVAGILNLRSKWTFLERPGLGLAASLSVLWGHGDWMWTFGRDLSAVDVVALPLSLFASFSPLAWLQLDLELCYRHAELLADVDTDSLFVASRIGLRSFSLRLATRFYIAQKLELWLDGTLPMYATLPGQLETEATLTEGVRAGARAAGYHKLAFPEGAGAGLSLRSAVARTTFIQASLHYGKRVDLLYSHAFYPDLGVEHRF